MVTIIKINGVIRHYFNNIDVDEIFLCGSYVKGLAADDSDVDFLIFPNYKNKTKMPVREWQIDLESVLGCNVDIIVWPKEANFDGRFAHYQRLFREGISLYKKQPEIDVNLGIH